MSQRMSSFVLFLFSFAWATGLVPLQVTTEANSETARPMKLLFSTNLSDTLQGLVQSKAIYRRLRSDARLKHLTDLEIEEVQQEFLFRFCRRISKRGITHLNYPDRYIWRAARNFVTDYCRRTKRRELEIHYVPDFTQYIEQLGHPGANSVSSNDTADEDAELLESFKIIESTIEQMPEKRRAVMTLWFSSYSLEEIAQGLQIAHATAANHYWAGVRDIEIALEGARGSKLDDEGPQP